MRRRAFLMGGKQEPNTIIGGVGGTITTKSALATKLGISESIIKGFKIVGSDIHARITDDYNVPLNAFNSDLTITSYHDLEGKVNTILGNAFRDCINLTSVTFYNVSVSAYAFGGCVNLTSWTGSIITLNQYSLSGIQATPDPTPIIFLHNYAFYNTQYLELILPNLTTLNYQPFRSVYQLERIVANNLHTITETANLFQGSTNVEEIEMKKLTYYGAYGNTTPTAIQSGFANIKVGCVIKVNEALSPTVLGYEHGSLLWAKDNRSAIVEFYDDAGNYVSTL